ncbi:MAG: hypothetical protein IJI50_03500 [Ruminococcus sp.]|nr:hypothetical protein [Ruminococcus sp.]
MDNKAARVPVKGNLRIKPHEDGEGYIVFNLDTSGLHYITGDLYALLEKVDGKLSIKDLSAIFAAERGLDEETLVNDFIVSFDALEERNIIRFA